MKSSRFWTKWSSRSVCIPSSVSINRWEWINAPFTSLEDRSPMSQMVFGSDPSPPNLSCRSANFICEIILSNWLRIHLTCKSNTIIILRNIAQRKVIVMIFAVEYQIYSILFKTFSLVDLVTSQSLISFVLILEQKFVLNKSFLDRIQKQLNKKISWKFFLDFWFYWEKNKWE